MNRAILTAAVAVVASVAGVLALDADSHAAGAGIPCIGDPFAESYPEPRVFLEAQSWWSDGGVAENGGAEHVHIGACFPLQQTVSGNMTLHLRLMGHNLPWGTVISSTLVHDSSGTAYAKARWDLVVDSNDEVAHQYVTVNTNLVPDGLRETRVLTVARRPNAAEIHTSSGWCYDAENGKSDTDSSTCHPTNSNQRRIEGRGWYDCFEYKVARMQDWTYPYSGVSRGSSYRFETAMRDGAGTNGLVTSHEARMDPDFHAGNLGTLLASGTGSADGKMVSIPRERMISGIHKIVLLTHVEGSCTSGAGKVPQMGEVTGVMVIPIRVY